ncbi:MAG TPA: cation:proton antiporter [Myxococcaceae bacterium]|nr:cation:proton antiporter [Myxococcaceae bacterium]
MALFEIALILLFTGALLSAAARRLSVPYPALVALAGVGLALVPNLPRVALDPQLALTLFVAPVLLDAAFDSSPRDLKENWRELTALALGAVVLTVIAVAMVARYAVPELSWPAAIALGAIVAPPDAAAATAVLKQLRPPHRLLVVLEGESLFNDASALLIYRLALGAVAGALSGWTALPISLAAAAGSVLLAAVLSVLALALLDRIRDVATAVIIQFLSTFVVWMLADRLHLSAIITTVVFAILAARHAPARTPARLRIPSYAVWEVAVFVLNVLAFILVGLQLKPIVQALTRHQLVTYAATAGAVCATVIVARVLWVVGYTWIGHLVRHRRARTRPAPHSGATFRSAVVIGWCGMRGIVSLAAALALPADFPHRDLILFASFFVVLGTLVLQGGTLSPLMRLLHLEDDGSVAREVRLARAETVRAALEEVKHATGADLVLLLRKTYETRLRRAERAGDPGAPANREGDSAEQYLQAVGRAQAAERRTLIDLRARGVIGDDAFHRVEEELDWAELHRESMLRAD